MKTISVLILIICISLAFWQRKNSAQSNPAAAVASSIPHEAAGATGKLAALREQLAQARENSRAAVLAEQAARRAKGPSITQTATEFGQGFRNNVVVDDTLHLDGKTAPLGPPNPHPFMGTYTSPEEYASESFDTLSVSYQLSLSEESALRFEFRTRGETGDWSPWRDLGEQVNFPIALGSKAVSWQYRLTFSAKEISASPRIYNVTMTSMNGDALTASVDGASNSEQLQ
jgi:hypothetical protein